MSEGAPVSEPVELFRPRRADARQRDRVLTAKVSYGIALFWHEPEAETNEGGKYKPGRIRVLLVRRRYTYAYIDFVYGRYGKNARSLGRLFNAMTAEELLTVRTFNFEMMWNVLWKEKVPRSVHYSRDEIYMKTHAKFSSYVMRSSATIQNVIDNTESKGNILWEIPKGHKDFSRETDVMCAVREMEEETGFSPDTYKIIPSFIHEVKYDHRKTRYILRYYVAVLHEDRSPKCDDRGFVAVKGGSGRMLNEVSSIRWMTLNEVKFVDDKSYHLHKTLAPFFSFAKKYVKNKVRLPMIEPDFEGGNLPRPPGKSRR